MLKLKISIVIFSLVVCTIVAFLNPVLCTNLDDGNFSQGEVFTPVNGTYDFNAFSLNSSVCKNFTAKHVVSGHTVLVDDTGEKTVNVIRLDKMISFKRDSTRSFLEGELQKTNWIVDGVSVHEIELNRGNVYSACVKDTSTGTLIYIATPDENETAAMINSIVFK